MSKRLHPFNPLNSITVLMFLSTDIVRHSVLDILAIAPNFCHAHFSCFQSSPVAKILIFLFPPSEKDSCLSLYKACILQSCLINTKNLSNIKNQMLVLVEMFSAGWHFTKQCSWIVSGPLKNYRLSRPRLFQPSSKVLPLKIMELFRLENTFRIIGSNHKPSTAKTATTNHVCKHHIYTSFK